MDKKHNIKLRSFKAGIGDVNKIIFKDFKENNCGLKK